MLLFLKDNPIPVLIAGLCACVSLLLGFPVVAGLFGAASIALVFVLFSRG